MIRTIYAQWVSNDNPDYRNELAEKLGQDDPYTTHKQSKAKQRNATQRNATQRNATQRNATQQSISS
ncbi:hypothetical protein [Aeromonas media]|uniref:hypothetical protein n=1 Tax=Aeromonas media TaxID=651 RepID=UPI0022816AB4|nr:hypothetical protein [Aeromonas media]MCY9838244.1 hypothetical protein [Aeromonas media]